MSTEEFPRPLTAAGARAASAYDGPPYPPDVRDEEIAMVLDAEFPIALRGYERSAVDAYVRRVSRVIQELEASRSPQSAVRYALEQVSEQTRAILQQAHDSADAVASKSRVEADERLQRAERESTAIRAAGEQRIRELEDELAELWNERDRLLADMRDVSLRMHDIVVSAAERPAPAPLTFDDETEPVEPVDGAVEGWADDDGEGFDRTPIRALEAVPPPPDDPEPEPALADAPPPAPEEAAGPVAFEDEPPLGALDEPAAPIAAEEEIEAHLDLEPPPPAWHEPDETLRLELAADGDDDEPAPPAPPPEPARADDDEHPDQGDRQPPHGDPMAPDDLDTRERPR